MDRIGMRAVSCLVVLLVAGGVFGGCAGYKIQENGTGCGYDVYAPEPYLQATPKMVKNGAGQDVLTCEFTLIWLPNYSKRYRVHSWAGLGKIKFKATFTNGWQLTSIDEDSDNTNILTALTTLAQQLLPKDLWDEGKAVAVVQSDEPDPKLAPLIYRIDFDECGRPACLVRLRVSTAKDCPKAGAFPIDSRCPPR